MGKERGKHSKGGRGGGKIYIENVDELEIQDTISKFNKDERAKRRGADEANTAAGADSSSENESGEEVCIIFLYLLCIYRCNQ
jgi:hypothetical protein